MQALEAGHCWDIPLEADNTTNKDDVERIIHYKDGNGKTKFFVWCYGYKPAEDTRELYRHIPHYYFFATENADGVQNNKAFKEVPKTEKRVRDRAQDKDFEKSN